MTRMRNWIGRKNPCFPPQFHWPALPEAFAPLLPFSFSLPLPGACVLLPPASWFAPSAVWSEPCMMPLPASRGLSARYSFRTPVSFLPVPPPYRPVLPPVRAVQPPVPIFLPPAYPIPAVHIPWLPDTLPASSCHKHKSVPHNPLCSAYLRNCRWS